MQTAVLENHTIVSKKHAKLSCSGSERWMNCPGSVALSAKAPTQRESEYAKEGTEAHEAFEYLIKNWKKRLAAEDFIERKYGAQVRSYISQMADEVFRRAPKGVEVISETKVDLSFLGDDMFGTADVIIPELFGRLTVGDLKYGAGIPVEPEENTQLLLYALGVAHQYDYNFEEICILVLQPRAEHEKGPIREWVISIHELKEWARVFEMHVESALNEEAELTAGDWCRFCPAAAICPEISRNALGKARGVFGPIEEMPSSKIELPDPYTILDSNLGQVLSGLSLLEKWIDSVREYAMNRAEKGKKIEGYKLVEKRSIRKWRDDDEATKAARRTFGDSAFTNPELHSPAQLEKRLPNASMLVEKFIKKYSSNASSGLTLVPESDKREEVSRTNPFLLLDQPEPRKENIEMATKKKTTKKNTKKKTTKR